MKTLHFVVRVTVPDSYSIVGTQTMLLEILYRQTAGIKQYKPSIFRPRRRLGILLRRLDKKAA